MQVGSFRPISLLRSPVSVRIMPPRQSLLVTFQARMKGGHLW
jgi:hypothetical protein